jgi:hypothetical protein
MATSRTEALARLARQLGAQRTPYYVGPAQAAGSGRPPGWYWQPAGAEEAVYLDVGAGPAEHQLRNMLDAQRSAAA